MRILLDLQACQTPTSRSRGIGRYSLSLAQAMVRAAPQHEFWLLLNSSYPETVETITDRFDGLIPSSRIVTFTPPLGAREAESGNDWLSRAGEMVRAAVIDRIAPDAVHVCSLFEGAHDDCIVSVCESSSTVTAVTLYDLIPLLNEERYLSNPLTRRWYTRKIDSLARADVLLCISNSAKNEADAVPALASVPKLNISSAVDTAVFFSAPVPDGSKKHLRTLGINRPFVLYTGGIDWRKNIERLIEAYASLPLKLRRERQLVLVCHAEEVDKNRLLTHAQQSGLCEGEVILTGYISDEELILLYRTCELFVFPSLHEGFGLPALEAMCCGSPVIGSNTSSLPEVIENPDAMFDPSSVVEMCILMGKALTDPVFRDVLLNNGRKQALKFSWELSARRAVEAIEAAVQQRESSERSGQHEKTLRRPSLAMVTPIPPLRSGIADYCSELLPYLSEHYEITVICDLSGENGFEGISASVPVKGVRWFRQHAASFDRIVYQFGNSEFHAHMFDLLLEFPGAVVLHDFYLSGVLGWMEQTGYSKEPFSRALMRSHGHAGLAYAKSQGHWSAIEKYPCSSFVSDRATGVIVHSRYSMQMADQFYGEGYSSRWAHIPQLRSLPQVGAQARIAARNALGIEPDDFLVCSFGFVSPSKLNDRLLTAWKKSKLGMHRSSKLVFVGLNDPGAFGQGIDKAIAALPECGGVSITGFVDSKLFETYLAACDLAVQLRGQSRGETSRAVLDCMAYGVPVIVNANGPMAEYPDSAVYKLDDQFIDDDLVVALDKLWHDADERLRIAFAGRDLIAKYHDPTAVAEQYRRAIECFYAFLPYPGYWGLLARISRTLGKASDQELISCAVMVQANADLV